MQTHRKTKLEIIVEAPLVRRVGDLLTAEGVKSFIVLHADSGRDGAAAFADTGVTDALERRMMVAVTADDVAERLLERLGALFARYPGAVFRSAVDVLRSEKF